MKRILNPLKAFFAFLFSPITNIFSFPTISVEITNEEIMDQLVYDKFYDANIDRKTILT